MDNSNHSKQLKDARSLVAALENNDLPQAEQCLLALSDMQETTLFQEVGKLTRELYEALNNVDIDPRLIDLAGDIPNTQERLNFVLTTTEEATHKMLGHIDDTMPLASTIKQSTTELAKIWHRFRMKEISATELATLTKEMDSYLPQIQQHSEQIHANLSAMILAQEFQDLTGQVIHQVINLVEEVEKNLVELIKVTGTNINQKPKQDKRVDPTKAEGPQINAKDNPDVINNQDEVDDLLLSLGF